MNQKLIALIVVAVIVMRITCAHAIDVGDPVFGADISGNLRMEFLYERYDRDIRLEYGPLVLAGPRGTVTIQPEEDTSELEGDIFMFRATLFASDVASVYAHAGILDDSEIKGTAYSLGAGFRLLAYQKDDVRISVFGSAHYIPSYDSEWRDFDPDLGREEARGSAELYELSAGVILARVFPLDESTAFIPYVGAAISILRGDFDATIDYTDVGIKATVEADIKEDQPVHAIVGASFLFNDNWSLRAEGRFIGASSISGGIGFAF